MATTMATTAFTAVPAAPAASRATRAQRVAGGGDIMGAFSAPLPLGLCGMGGLGAGGVMAAARVVSGTGRLRAGARVHASWGGTGSSTGTQEGQGGGDSKSSGQLEGGVPGWALHLACGAAIAGAVALGVPEAAEAVVVRQEPANALSIPTWAIHISSLVEWLVGMGLVWKYADVSNTPEFKGLTWGMLPLHASGICACTYHLFYNSQDVEVLIAVQAFLTCVGNCTLWWAAYRIYLAAEKEREEAEAEAEAPEASG